MKDVNTLVGILKKSHPATARVYLVGGTVRDKLLRRSTRDCDVVVTGVPQDELEQLLKKHGTVRLAGKSFGVYKWGILDIALPRLERGWGTGGRRDTEVQSDYRLPIEEDLSRRDFTINAIAYDITARRYIDPFNGRHDLAQRLIRAVGNPKTRFLEDYSRMLRAIRLSCELEYPIEKNTWQALKKNMHNVKSVAKEIAALELVRALCAKPTRALELFEKSKLLNLIFPEFSAMQKCSQPKKWHAEGNVWAHTKLALLMLENRTRGPWDPHLILAMLLHDIGKPRARRLRHGRITFYGHDTIGVKLADKMIKRLKLESVGIRRTHILWLIKNHMVGFTNDPTRLKNTTIEKYFLNNRYPSHHLLTLIEYDSRASIPADAHMRNNLQALLIIKRRIAEIEKRPPKPILNGHEIMKILNTKKGGPHIGTLLQELREAELGGKIRTKREARKFIQKQAKIYTT